MASVTSFIRNTPASSLQAYFPHTGIELPTEVDWEASEPEVARVILRAVDELDDEARAQLLNEADRVGSLADDVGQTALYSVIDDRTILDDLANGYARSL
jgi:hypothetical protein